MLLPLETDSVFSLIYKQIQRVVSLALIQQLQRQNIGLKHYLAWVLVCPKPLPVKLDTTPLVAAQQISPNRHTIRQRRSLNRNVATTLLQYLSDHFLSIAD